MNAKLNVLLVLNFAFVVGIVVLNTRVRKLQADADPALSALGQIRQGLESL